MSDVPEQIYLPKEWCLDDLAPVVIVDQPAEDDDLAFVPLSVANAMVGAAYEDAAKRIKPGVQVGASMYEKGAWDAYKSAHGMVLSSTPADARAAYEAALEQARKQGRDEWSAEHAKELESVVKHFEEQARREGFEAGKEAAAKEADDYPSGACMRESTGNKIASRIRAIPINPRKEKDDG